MDDEGEDISRRRRMTMKSESFVKTRSTSSCATPRYQWRSISWSNHAPVCSPEDEADCSSSDPPQDENEGDMQKLCPPLQLLSVSKASTSGSDGKGFRKGGRCLDIKLDLGIIEKTVPEEEPCGSEMQQQEENSAVEKDRQCSQISSYLFVAGRSVAQNYAVLQSYRITHILNCVGLCCPEYYPNEFHYKTLWLHDKPSEDLVCVLYDVFDYLENVREQAGCQVLVHCSEGVSRSAALVIAYIMWRDHQTFDQVFERMKSIRPSTNPNLGFVFQLMQWQTRILNPDSSHMYRMAPQSPYDPLYIVPKSLSSPSLDALDSRFAFVVQSSAGLHVWRGRHCEKTMAAAADKAAFQLIRYEHAHGPIVTVCEGSEPASLVEVLQACSKKEEELQHQSPRQRASSARIDGHSAERTVSDYNADYELYTRARMGEVSTPVRTPLSATLENLRSPLPYATATLEGSPSSTAKRLAK